MFGIYLAIDAIAVTRLFVVELTTHVYTWFSVSMIIRRIAFVPNDSFFRTQTTNTTNTMIEVAIVDSIQHRHLTYASAIICKLLLPVTAMVVIVVVVATVLATVVMSTVDTRASISSYVRWLSGPTPFSIS